MSVMQKLKQLFGGDGKRKRRAASSRSKRSGDMGQRRGESLPGGAGGREAAEASPQRAAELAD